MGVRETGVLRKSLEDTGLPSGWRQNNWFLHMAGHGSTSKRLSSPTKMAGHTRPVPAPHRMTSAPGSDPLW